MNDAIDLAGKNLTNLEGLQDIPTIDQAQTLYLNDNQLQMLPGIFNGLHNLNRLILSNNQLQTLPVGIFNGLNNLAGLSLDNNQLQTLPVGAFNGLNNLRQLSLDENQLQTLPTGIFNGLNNLDSLYLYGNPFTGEFSLTLPAILKAIPQLKYLDNKPVDQALQSYRVYQPKSLLETTKKYLMENLTPENLEELAEVNPTAFNLLPLSQEQKKAILDRVANINRQDRFGNTPLMNAVRKGKIEAVKLLLERGADIKKQNNNHQTALTIADELGNRAILRLLAQAAQASQKKYVESVQKQLRRT